MTTVQLDTKKLPTSSKELSYPVPTNIHLIWVAPLPKAVQCERIKEWVHKKSNVTVYLWVDSKLFDTVNRNELDSSEISLTDNLSNKTKESASRAKVNSNLRCFPPTMAAQNRVQPRSGYSRRYLLAPRYMITRTRACRSVLRYWTSWLATS